MILMLMVTTIDMDLPLTSSIFRASYTTALFPFATTDPSSNCFKPKDEFKFKRSAIIKFF